MTARRCAKLSNEGNTEKHEGGQEVFVWDKPNVWKISRFRVAAVDLASPVLCRWLVWTTKKGVSSAICEMGRHATGAARCANKGRKAVGVGPEATNSL